MKIGESANRISNDNDWCGPIMIFVDIYIIDGIQNRLAIIGRYVCIYIYI